MAPKSAQGCNNEIGAMVKKAKHGAEIGAIIKKAKHGAEIGARVQ